MWKFIGVSGPIGAGKTTLCTILIERGYKYLSFGKLVGDIVKKERTIYSRRELQDRGEELIRDLGYPGIVNLLFEKNKVDKASNHVVDGIRHLVSPCASYHLVQFVSCS
ncbi:MAG: AAA family ATPase [Theionarchaea archaeon]|nr:AAA family ATPase [Theionarchaea archaeon]